MNNDQPKGNPREVKEERRSDEDRIADPKDVAESKRARWEEYRETHNPDNHSRG